MSEKIKIYLFFIAILAIIGSHFYNTMFAPSANLNNYSACFINDTTTAISAGAVRVTFFGTSSLLFDDGETQLLIDGYFSRPSLLNVLFGKLTSDTMLINNVLSKNKIDKLKAIFVVHSHFDHAIDAPYITKVTNSILYGSASLLNIGRGGGLSENQMALYEPGKEIQFGKFAVTILKSKHVSLPAKLNDIGQEITQPLKQPAKMKDFKEGGSFDIVMKHEGHTILIKASCNYIENALDTIKADVVFLGVAGLINKDSSFQYNYYQQTVGKINPKMVIPIHWDNFFKPLNENLKPYPKYMNNVEGAFNYLIKRTKADGIDFRLLQGNKHVLLF